MPAPSRAVSICSTERATRVSAATRMPSVRADARPGPSSSVSRSSPEESITVTALGFRFGTAAETRWRIDKACLRSIAARPRMRTTTDAVGLGALRENSSRSGRTMWTRAASTPASVSMVRPSSPSMARRRLMRCMKLVMPSGLSVSNSS